MELLQNLDQTIFLWINQSLANFWSDKFFMTITNAHKIWWFQLFLGLFVLAPWIYLKRTQAIKVIVMVALTAGVADLFSYRVIKQISHRDRPHNTEQFRSNLKFENGPSDSSFPSNHATNTAAMATILFWVYPKWFWLFALWTFSISWSRVAVGVHYPSDVLVGVLLGGTIASILIYAVFNQIPWFKTAKNPQSKGPS